MTASAFFRLIDWAGLLGDHYAALAKAKLDERCFEAWEFATRNAFWSNKDRWLDAEVSTYLFEASIVSELDPALDEYTLKKKENLDSLPPRDFSAHPKELQDLEAYVESCRQTQIKRLADLRDHLSRNRRTYRIRCSHVAWSWWTRTFQSSVYIDSGLVGILFESVDGDSRWY